MALLTQTPYKARTFDLSGLTGISDNTLEVHFGLYAGYVKNTNLLNEQLVTMQQAGQGLASNPSYSEITRRLGFEYNGMVLHEWYFGNLTKASGGGISSSSALGRALGESFGDIDTWRKDFTAIGGMRGVGWAVTYLDTATGRLSNHWITLHEDGNIAGLQAHRGDGRLGARVPARLQAGRPSEVHRGLPRELRRRRGRGTPDRSSGPPGRLSRPGGPSTAAGRRACDRARPGRSPRPSR